MGDVEAVEKA